MRKTITILAALVAALALASAAAYSQQDMKTVPTGGFSKTTRPAAVFDHEAHNEKAKLADCGVCHHGGKDGKLDKNATSEGQPCADCHPAKAGKGITPLERAYHRMCGDCHDKAGKGPVACGQCHKRGGPAQAPAQAPAKKAG